MRATILFVLGLGMVGCDASSSQPAGIACGPGTRLDGNLCVPEVDEEPVDAESDAVSEVAPDGTTEAMSDGANDSAPEAVSDATSDVTNDTVAPPVVCGPGTHLDGTTCFPDACPDGGVDTTDADHAWCGPGGVCLPGGKLASAVHCDAATTCMSDGTCAPPSVDGGPVLTACGAIFCGKDCFCTSSGVCTCGGSCVSSFGGGEIACRAGNVCGLSSFGTPSCVAPETLPDGGSVIEACGSISCEGPYCHCVPSSIPSGGRCDCWSGS